MEIKVNVLIDFSERAQGFLSSLLGHSPAKAETVKAETPTPTAEAAPTAEPTPTAEPDPSVQMPFDTETAEAPKPEPKKPEAPAEPVVATDQVLKDYMDLVFKGLIGDDWRETVQSEPAMKVRRAEITRIFKTIAAELGAVKPTLLPQSKRSEFIQRLNNITLGDDGRVQYLPF